MRKRGLIAMAILFVASVTAGWAAGIKLPDGPGVNLVYGKCQICHDLQYVNDSRGLLPAQWDAVLAGMKDYGLAISAQDRKQILAYLTTYLGSNPPPAPSAATPAAKADGHAVFEQSCTACHGPEGRGQPGAFPPLAGNPDLNKGEVFPVLVVLHGLTGPIEVKGAVYNGTMPSFQHLSDAEIAAVINFLRDSWGNQALQPRPEPITAETVAAQRARDMTPDAVHAYRAGMK